jgi:hypothetical protein
MTSHVDRDKSIAIGQCRMHLSSPGEPTLRKAMDKYNRTSARVARFNDVELSTSAAAHHVMLHCVAPLLVLCVQTRVALRQSLLTTILFVSRHSE